MKVIKLKNNPAITPDELDRQAVGTAIVILHGEGRYYEAMDLLCRVVGWPPVVRGFATAEAMDAWIAKVRGVPVAVERKAKSKKCQLCGRYFNPFKKLQRKSIDPCRVCGRGFYRRGNTK